MDLTLLKMALFAAKFVPVPGVAAAAAIAEEAIPLIEAAEAIAVSPEAKAIAQKAMPVIEGAFQLIGKHVANGLSIDEAVLKAGAGIVALHAMAPDEEQALFDRAKGNLG